MTHDATTHREEADTILRKIGGASGSGRDADDVVGAIVGVGHALLAIHDEIRAIGERTENALAGGRRRFDLHQNS